MDNIIANIFDLADYADNFGHVNLAKKLDAHANSLLNIKIAQYVGGQGYAVRNSRCWSNCYRQKRAQKPEMPAQLVWQDCHKEYVDSINKDGSNWDKYASGFNFIKTSQKDEIAHEIYQMKFAQVIDEQLASGATYAFAIENATQKFNDILNEQYNHTNRSIAKLSQKNSYDDIIDSSLEKIVANMQQYASQIKMAQAAPAPAAGAPPATGAPATPGAPAKPGTPAAAQVNIIGLDAALVAIKKMLPEPNLVAAFTKFVAGIKAANNDFKKIAPLLPALDQAVNKTSPGRDLVKILNDAGFNAAKDVVTLNAAIAKIVTSINAHFSRLPQT